MAVFNSSLLCLSLVLVVTEQLDCKLSAGVMVRGLVTYDSTVAGLTPSFR